MDDYPTIRAAWDTYPAERVRYAERQRAHRQKQRARLQATCVEISPNCTLYLGNAYDIVPLLKDVDTLVTDPPYGANYNFAKPRRSTCPLQGVPAARWSASIHGDDRPFDPTPWLGYAQVVLWGADHYYHQLPPAGAWLVWDKRDGSTSDDHADCEMAWTNIPGPARLWSQKWRGVIRAGEENVVHGPKCHPAQKPAALMQWCVEKTTGVVLDPFMG